MHQPTHRERRPCACRGWIEADPYDVDVAIQAHQATDDHLDWRQAELDAGRLVEPETPAETLARNLTPPAPVVFRSDHPVELAHARRPNGWGLR